MRAGRSWLLVGVMVGLAVVDGPVWRLERSAGAAPGYPAPRFPRYLRTVTSVDPLMPSARLAARQIGGRTPLGLVQRGEHLVVAVPDEQDPLVLEAIKRALEERGVKVTVLRYYQLEGLSEAQARENLAHRKRWLTYGDQGWKEIGTFNTRLVRFLSEAEQRAIAIPPPPHRGKDPLEALVAYVAAHPDVDRVVYGFGGRARQQRAFGKNAGKFLGNWTYTRQTDLLSKVPEFPGDVWKLAEEKVLDPLPFAGRVRMTDPEGTDVAWTVTDEEAEKWAKAAYLQGHIFLYPLQGSRGILEAAFDRQVFPDSNGVIAGCSNHTAFFPCARAYIEHGQIVRLEGGGRMGDLVRSLLAHPELKQARYPDAPRPGYWYWFEAALGTNPKYFRPIHELLYGGVGAVNTFERNRSGVFHFGMGLETLDPEARRFCEANRLPCDHSWHIHNYFATYTVTLRDEDARVTLVDRGRLAVLDSAEVRALASRYGNPDLILREEWVPGIPGINLPGDYRRDYAPDPWKWIKGEIEQIEKGTYPHLIDDYPTPEGLLRTRGQ
jgi:hypothetical protein